MAGAAGRPQADVFLPAPGQSSVGGGGGKILGMNRNTALIVGGVVAVIAAYLIWKHIQSGSAGSAAGGTTADQSALSPDQSGGGASGGGQPDQSQQPQSQPFGGTTTQDSGLVAAQNENNDLLGIVGALIGSLSTNGADGASTKQPTTSTVTNNYYGTNTKKSPAVDTSSKLSSVGGGVQAVLAKPSATVAIHGTELPPPVSGSASSFSGAAADVAASFFGAAPVVVAPPVAPYTPAPKTAAAPYTVNITANKTGGSANKTQGVFSVH